MRRFWCGLLGVFIGFRAGTGADFDAWDGAQGAGSSASSSCRSASIMCSRCDKLPPPRMWIASCAARSRVISRCSSRPSSNWSSTSRPPRRWALPCRNRFCCALMRSSSRRRLEPIGNQMAKPGPHGKDKQRCGALVRHRHGFCRRWPVPGKARCRFHGGCSTGARTQEGKARALAAMRAGRQGWLEDMRAKKAAGEIDRFPGGRKSGARWVTLRMWEQRQIEMMQRLRAAREALEPPSPPPPPPSGTVLWSKTTW
jgi:hypothetical protein